MITLKAFRVGGLRFLRIGRLQLSMCIVRRPRMTLHIAGQTFIVTL